ncbi:hypothetical protein MRS44_017199 [Fusarium solani]|uniref:uncharacterized protein n=1 Tax=Fusarium solani TaxID=169388 RepID=UPI0032C46AF7|nr:hypothetical protein MRS44_017199 [Fusarium solani]
MNGFKELIGTHWLEGFLRRNKEVKTMRGQRLDSERFNGVTTENIKGFFNHLKRPSGQVYQAREPAQYGRILWLKKTFTPQTKPATKGDKRLLIIDGHGSHVSDDFMIECFWNDIHIIYLIPHSSHVLQLLDVTVFDPVKQKYRRLISGISTIEGHTPIGKCTFLQYYYEARKHGMTSTNIIAG